jgi:hypothetical protein
MPMDCNSCAASINPVEEIIEHAHKFGAKVLLDACQSVPHMPVDVQALDVDFLVASSHKVWVLKEHDVPTNASISHYVLLHFLMLCRYADIMGFLALSSIVVHRWLFFKFISNDSYPIPTCVSDLPTTWK